MQVKLTKVRKIGKENIIVVASREKMMALYPAPLLVDKVILI